MPAVTERIPEPGLLGLTHISGRVGKVINVLQLLNGDGLSGWEHAYALLPGGQILEAEPGGAVIRPMHYAPENIYWCWGIYDHCLPSEVKNGTPWAYQRIMDVAESLKGTPYSFLDYLALGAHRLGIRNEELRRYIEDTGHEICSELDDDLYMRLGGHIFEDERWKGYVTPGMLWKRDLELIRQYG